MVPGGGLEVGMIWSAGGQQIWRAGSQGGAEKALSAVIRGEDGAEKALSAVIRGEAGEEKALSAVIRGEAGEEKTLGAKNRGDAGEEKALSAKNRGGLIGAWAGVITGPHSAATALLKAFRMGSGPCSAARRSAASSSGERGVPISETYSVTSDPLGSLAMGMGVRLKIGRVFWILTSTFAHTPVESKRGSKMLSS